LPNGSKNSLKRGNEGSFHLQGPCTLAYTVAGPVLPAEARKEVIP